MMMHETGLDARMENTQVYVYDRSKSMKTVWAGRTKGSGNGGSAAGSTGVMNMVTPNTVQQNIGGIKGNPVLTGGGNGGIINNVELPAETAKIRSMSEETKSLISKAFDDLLRDYDIRIDIIETIPLNEEFKNVPFQFSPLRGEDGRLIKRIIINSNYDFMGSQAELQARIMRNYNSRALASNSIEGLISHELAHVMTFQDCYTYSGYLLANKQVSEEIVYGISRYADASLDGAECIAEAFAAKRCQNTLSDEAQKLLDKYIERWKK